MTTMDLLLKNRPKDVSPLTNLAQCARFGGFSEDAVRDESC